MPLSWAILGFTILGAGVRSAAGWFEGVRYDGEETDWKRLGVSLAQAVVLGVVAGLLSFTGSEGLLAGLLGTQILDKIGLNYKE